MPLFLKKKGGMAVLDIYGSYFSFGGEDSKHLHLIISNIDSDRYVGLNGEYSPVTITNKKTRRRVCVGGDYANSAVSVEVDIVTSDGRCLDDREQRTIHKWLFRRGRFDKLYIDDSPAMSANEYVNCMFINPSRLEFNGGIVGYRVTMVMDSDMALTDVVSVHNVSGSQSGIVKEFVDTDGGEYVYPVLKIRFGSSGGDVSIMNLTDNDATGLNRTLTIVSVTPGDTVYIDSRTNRLSGGYYQRLASRDFVRLMDGENNIRIAGDVDSVSLEYTARRFM